MPKELIFIIEDEKDIADLLEYNLAKEGYRIKQFSSGEAGLKAAQNDAPDLVILDLMLPGMDGLNVCKILKENDKTKHVPVVMLTAKSEEVDIVTGLEIGADDYITKPFSPRVVLARLRAVLRRKDDTKDAPAKMIKIGDLTIHPGHHEVTVKNKKIALTHTEFKMLHTLASRPGWAFTRYQLVNSIRGEDIVITDRTIDVHIAGLRKKLGSAGNNIETIRGVGYRFKE